jgi:bifunctional DNA-binding transcriptional regulator/antitoxin component of YhaV-PrlF toxin-antitoxin module
MKLQKQLSRKSGDIEYPKFVTVIPPETVKQLNWKGGDELEAEIRNGVLCIKKKK